MMKTSPYSNSTEKRILDVVLSVIAIILASPVIILVAVILKMINHGPVIFIQKRTGKDGKPFTIYKFRTMKVGAHKLQKKYKHLNISDGPAFKIYNDPRLTPFGKILFKTGLDELPQLINVLRGEMSLVGPRPLPVEEAYKLNNQQKKRQLVKPGITSSWIVNGGHQMAFSTWMKMDLEYVKTAGIVTDLSIIGKTILLGIKTCITNFF